MDLNPSSHWNALLESVKLFIPSIDSDSSSSENEDNITIFQRPAVVSPKVHIQEDLQCLSLEDAETEELWIPAAQTCQSEETSCHQSVTYEGEAVESTAVAQRGTLHSSADVGTDACENKILEFRGAKLNASVKTHLDNRKSDEGFPILSFSLLDQWDLDDILQTLKEDGPSVRGCVFGEPAKAHAEGDNERSQDDIMERLVAYCKRQSSGAESKPVSQSEPLQSPTHIKKNSVWSKSLERTAAELRLSHQECTTVYIDLRCPDPSIKTPRTCPSISSESKTVAKHSSLQETPPAKKPNLRVQPGSGTGDREVTGKSVLLRKLREMNGNENKHSNKPHDSELGNQGEELKDKLPQPLAPTCRHKSLPLSVDKQSSPVQSESKKPEVESPPLTQQSTTKEPKQQSYRPQKQQVKQTLQPEHQKILKELERHHPTKSVNDKQPAAEKTDVLYDAEASHLQSINNLPADIENKGYVLLTVSLPSPGVVVGNSHGKAQNLDSAATKSHIYNALVAWFLSLVGPGPRCDEHKAGAQVPFWVAGLQQLWREDGLALHILAVSHGESPQHRYKSRKWHMDTRNTFYHRVCRFLSHTSLSVTAHWLPQLKILLDQQAYAPAIHLPSSCLNCFISVSSDKNVIDRTFGLSPGFYWQTVETQEPICQRRETMVTQQLHTEVAVALGYKSFFLQPLVTHHTLQLLLDSGLDVCGLRLFYPPQGLPSDSAGGVPDIQSQPVLALAVRGPSARSVWQDLTGPSDPLLAKETNPASINALHCRSKDLPLFYSPHLAKQVHRDLCLWFSGRLQGGNSQNHSQPLNNRVVPAGDGVGGSLSNLTRSSAFLCATTKADMLLVVSPVVAPCCYSQVLAVCDRRGFSLRGLRRLQLHSKWAKTLGLTSRQVLVFSNPSTVTLDQEEVQLSSHCLILLLRRENGLRHCASLPAALIREFEAQKLLGCLRSRLNGVEAVEPSCCFHIVPYSDSLLNNFVKCMWAVPDPSGVVLSRQKCPSNAEMEQVVIFTLCGKDMSQGLSLLHRVLTGGPEGDVGHAGYELLGLKWLPALTRPQAQELSPYEAGERLWRGSLVSLMSSPALSCALRRVDAFASLRKLLPHDYPGNLSILMSPTPELAFRQASVLFNEGEMIPDHSARLLLKFLPRTCNTTGSLRESLFSCKVQDPQMLLTLCLFKPRVWNHALAKILRQVQLSGFTLVGLRVVTLDKTSAASLVSTENDPSDFEAHVQYLCSGPSLALCLQRENAVKRLLDVLGPEEQDQARAQDQFLWRACYGAGHLHSVIYGSGSYQRAIQDVKRLFPEGLCCTETNTMRQEQILSMCSDPLASLAREQSNTLAPASLSPPVASGLNGVPGSLIHSAVCQTTCLLLPSNVLQLSQVPSHLDLLEQLLRSDCHLVAGRLSVLDDEQRRHIAETLAVPSKRNGRMAHLHTGPCLIVALQRDDIVTRFDLILESIYRERSDLEKVGEMIIYPSSEKEAKQLICYLFDVLSPESHHAIVPQESKMQPS